MRSIVAPALVCMLTVASGCANINTVGRTTTLPNNSTQSGNGIAVHLDAQQRLVIYNAGKYCAEPSPDALQAYAASLGLGVGIPSQGAGSLAAAQQSNAGSIGLRTQSITIMRDALYRMCEAYNNDVLGSVMVTTLLARSQDLTAVILAVEQLTGAVAANQIILTGSAGASSSASLVSNDQALAAAKKNEEKREAEVEEATAVRDKAQADLDDAKSKEETAQRELDAVNAQPSPTEADVNAATVKVSRARETRESAEKKLSDAGNELKVKQELLENATDVREAIEAGLDSALTDANAHTGGAGQFSVVVPAKQLSAEATKEIAVAVQNMVNKVLDKSYAADSCMALLASPSTNPERLAELRNVRQLCMALIAQGIQKELDLAKTQ